MEIKLNETYIMKNGDEVEITFTDGMTSWPFRCSNGEYYSKQGKRLKIDDDSSFDIQEIRRKMDREKLDNAMKCELHSDKNPETYWL